MQDDWSLVADAFRSVADVLKQIHAIFVVVVLMSIMILVGSIAGAAWILLVAIDRMEQRSILRDKELVIGLRAISDRLQVNQVVTVAPQRTRDDNIRDILRKQGQIDDMPGN